MKKFLKLVHEVILGICFVTLLLAGLIAFGTKFNIPGGFSIYSILTGSMEPQVPVGALIVTKIPRSNDDIKQGDIITFNEPGFQNKFVTHRVYNVIEQGSVKLYQTKGDANSSPDPWRIAYGSIKGVYQIEFPYLGFFLEFIKSPIGISIFVLIPVVLIFFSELMNLFHLLFQVKVEKERTKDEGFHSYSLIIPILVSLVLVSIGGSKTFALLTSPSVQILGNEIVTATPKPTQTPTPTATPTSSPSASPCGGDINISNNGEGSDNSVTENCNSSTTVTQTDNSNVQNNVNVSSNTGGNSTSDNTSTSTQTTTGSSSTTVTVTNQTGSNQ